MRTDEDFAKKVNLYLSQDKNPPAPYHGETEVLHYLELVTRGSGFEKIHAAVKNPLNGKRVAAYYGCMLLRPAKVIEFDDPENPQIIEDFIRTRSRTLHFPGKKRMLRRVYRHG